MDVFTKVILETGPDGRSRFREEDIALSEAKPMLFLTPPMTGGAVQIRHSPVGYAMDFHPTASPQWTFVLQGMLQIGLPDGARRIFKAGDHLYSTDMVPADTVFDPTIHGHDSRQVGDEVLITALVRG